MNTLVSSIGEISISKSRTGTNYLSGRIAIRRKQKTDHQPALVNLLSSDDSVFDWFKSFKEIESILNKLIPDKSSHIIMLGCGNSTLSEDVSFHVHLRKLNLPSCKRIDSEFTQMYDAGYTNIVNIDYSASCIAKMKSRTRDRPLMTCKHSLPSRGLQS
jgi:hypothetical protein